jgi:hypothetical protein
MEYSTDWRMCQTSCGLIGHQRFESPICRFAMNGMLVVGVGLPIVSVRIPMMLWKCAVEPGRVRRAPPLRHARLPFGDEPHRHVRADDVDARDGTGMEVEVERIAERRREHHRALRPGLMVVVHDLRNPLAVHDAVDVRGFGERRHVEVAVVVVPRVVVVEHGDGHVAVLHVPVGHEIHAIRVDQHCQHDHVVQNPHRLRVGARRHLVDQLEELLRAERLVGVQTAVDPDDRLAFARERARLVVGQPFGQREPA